MKNKILNIFCFPLIVFLIPLLLTSTSEAKEVAEEVAVVMPVAAPELTNDIQRALTNLFVGEVMKSSKYDLISGKIVSDTLSLTSKKQGLGVDFCDELTCLQEVRIRFKADLILSMGIRVQGSAYLLSAKIADHSSKGEFLRSDEQCENCSIQQLEAKMKEVTQKIINKRAGTKGTETEITSLKSEQTKESVNLNELYTPDEQPLMPEIEKIDGIVGLFITSNPTDAAVYLDGILAGKTTFAFQNLNISPGTEVEVTLKKSDYHDYIFKVKLSEGITKFKNLNLKPAFGYLDLEGTPEGALVFLDGEKIGDLPIKKYKVSSGKHLLKVEKNLYETIDDKKIDIADAKITSEIINLADNSGLIKVISDPPDTVISLNGEAIGDAPLNGYRLPPGSYKLKISRLGYLDKEFDVNISRGQIFELTPLQATLKEKVFTLQVFTDPPVPDSIVFLDNFRKGSAPLTITCLAEGKHMVKIKAGGSIGTGEVVGFDGETKSISVKLIPGSLIGMVYLEGGCFGSQVTGGGNSDGESAYEKCVNDFFLGEHEVTQGEWKMVMGTTPPFYKSCGDECAVEKIPLEQVDDFIRKLNLLTDSNYRLPTRDEWDFALSEDQKEDFDPKEEFLGADNNDFKIIQPRNPVPSGDLALLTLKKNGVDLASNSKNRNNKLDMQAILSMNAEQFTTDQARILNEMFNKPQFFPQGKSSESDRQVLVIDKKDLSPDQVKFIQRIIEKDLTINRELLKEFSEKQALRFNNEKFSSEQVKIIQNLIERELTLTQEALKKLNDQQVFSFDKEKLSSDQVRLIREALERDLTSNRSFIDELNDKQAVRLDKKKLSSDQVRVIREVLERDLTQNRSILEDLKDQQALRLDKNKLSSDQVRIIREVLERDLTQNRSFLEELKDQQAFRLDKKKLSSDQVRVIREVLERDLTQNRAFLDDLKDKQALSLDKKKLSSDQVRIIREVLERDLTQNRSFIEELKDQQAFRLDKKKLSSDQVRVIREVLERDLTQNRAFLDDLKDKQALSLDKKKLSSDQVRIIREVLERDLTQNRSFLEELKDQQAFRLDKKKLSSDQVRVIREVLERDLTQNRSFLKELNDQQAFRFDKKKLSQDQAKVIKRAIERDLSLNEAFLEEFNNSQVLNVDEGKLSSDQALLIRKVIGGDLALNDDVADDFDIKQVLNRDQKNLSSNQAQLIRTLLERNIQSDENFSDELENEQATTIDEEQISLEQVRIPAPIQLKNNLSLEQSRVFQQSDKQAAGFDKNRLSFDQASINGKNFPKNKNNKLTGLTPYQASTYSEEEKNRILPKGFRLAKSPMGVAQK